MSSVIASLQEITFLSERPTFSYFHILTDKTIASPCFYAIVSTLIKMSTTVTKLAIGRYRVIFLTGPPPKNHKF